MNPTPSMLLERRTLMSSLVVLATGLLSQPSSAAEGRPMADGQPMADGHPPTEAGPWFSAFGLKMRIEVTGDATGGSMSATRVISPAGGGPPAHIHTREDEVFVILRGQYRFWQKGMPTIDAPAGSVIYQHKGMVHQYRNVAATEGEHIVMCLPAGLEQMFVKVAREGLVVPRDMQRAIALGAEYGLTYQPPIAN